MICNVCMQEEEEEEWSSRFNVLRCQGDREGKVRGRTRTFVGRESAVGRRTESDT